MAACERLMITQGGSATIVYNNHCKRTYDQPGVYKIPGSCKVIAYLPPTGGNGLGTLAVVGGVALATTFVTHDHHPVAPVSH